MPGVVYCPKCHKEAYRLEENGDNIKLIQNGRAIMKINKKSKVSMDMSCPSGHKVRLEIKPEQEKKDESS